MNKYTSDQRILPPLGKNPVRWVQPFVFRCKLLCPVTCADLSFKLSKSTGYRFSEHGLSKYDCTSLSNAARGTLFEGKLRFAILSPAVYSWYGQVHVPGKQIYSVVLCGLDSLFDRLAQLGRLYTYAEYDYRLCVPNRPLTVDFVTGLRFDSDFELITMESERDRTKALLEEARRESSLIPCDTTISLDVHLTNEGTLINNVKENALGLPVFSNDFDEVNYLRSFLDECISADASKLRFYNLVKEKAVDIIREYVDTIFFHIIRNASYYGLGRISPLSAKFTDVREEKTFTFSMFLESCDVDIAPSMRSMFDHRYRDVDLPYDYREIHTFVHSDRGVFKEVSVIMENFEFAFLRLRDDDAYKIQKLNLRDHLPIDRELQKSGLHDFFEVHSFKQGKDPDDVAGSSSYSNTLL